MTPPRRKPGRRRVRLHSVDSETTQDSRCRVTVEIEWEEGVPIRGEGRGTATPQGRMIAGGRATLEAIGKVAKGVMSVDLRGAKMVRAFDSLVIIVSLRADVSDRRYDLIGACQAPDNDIEKGVVLSVLDATNRVLELYVEPGGASGADEDEAKDPEPDTTDSEEENADADAPASDEAGADGADSSDAETGDDDREGERAV